MTAFAIAIKTALNPTLKPLRRAPFYKVIFLSANGTMPAETIIDVPLDPPVPR
jgi:hypothetical protein